MRANAKLMQSCGRTLWKIGDALAKHEKDVKPDRLQPLTPVPDQGLLNQRQKHIDDILFDRFYEIEKVFTTKLGDAGVYNDLRPEPKRLHKRGKKEHKAKETEKEKAAKKDLEVTVKADGEIDTTMNIADVKAALGLEGDGINQEVGVRDPSVLPVGFF